MQDCIFCKIISKDILAEIIFEDDDFIVFKDIKPATPIHVLLVPKKHIISIAQIEESDRELMGRLIWLAKNIAEDLNISEKGYRLTFNVGEDGGQEVKHLHLHLMGGAKMGTETKIIKD